MAKIRLALRLALGALGDRAGGGAGTNTGKPMGLLLALTYP